jgi:uncharacterized membrane protein YcjF (UPF0283 family)
MKKEKMKDENVALALDKKPDDTAFSDSISEAFKQKNEKGFFMAVVAIVAVLCLLVVGALADILTVCFEINRIFGYVMCGILAVLIGLFIIRPACKVLGARFFITDVADDDFDVVKRKNYKALRSVAQALVDYNTDPKNVRFRYLTDEKLSALKNALASGDKISLKSALKTAYATDVGGCVNALIWKSAGKVFLTTSISQNDKIDALSVLLVNLTLVKQIVGIYGYRPSYAKLFRVYFVVLRSALLAYGMQNVNWFNVFGKFFSGVAKKIPFLDTVVDSAVQGTVSAFMTVLVGYKTKKYLCSDYKKQEKIDVTSDELENATGVDVTDDEVKIAASLAKQIRNKNKDKIS